MKGNHLQQLEIDVGTREGVRGTIAYTSHRAIHRLIRELLSEDDRTLVRSTINIRKGSLGSVNTGTYLAFIVIMFIGTASTMLLLPPGKVVRGDGSVVKIHKTTSPKQELRHMVHVLADWRVWALLPMFFASNWFYVYQGSVNAFFFDGPTRKFPRSWSSDELIRVILVLLRSAGIFSLQVH